MATIFFQNFYGFFFLNFSETSLAAMATMKKSPHMRGDSGSIIIITQMKLLINHLSSFDNARSVIWVGGLPLILKY